MQICTLVNRCFVISNGNLLFAGTIHQGAHRYSDLSLGRQSAVVSLELCCSKSRCATLFNGGQEVQWMRHSLKETLKGNKTAPDPTRTSYYKRIKPCVMIKRE